MKRATKRLPGALLGAILAVSASAQTAAPEADSVYISLLDSAPPVYHGILRYPKFYGDPNMDRSTIDGSVLARQYLFGSLRGARDKWTDGGLLVDASVTQVAKGTVSGDGDGARYFGSGDLWMGLDTGRAQWWSGGLLFMHFEGNWGETVGGTGGLLPLNFDSTMPDAPSALAVSELYLFQALPADWAVLAGKVNFSAYADKNFFANDERNQFMHTGLNNNAILGAFVPYTSLGGGAFHQLTGELQVGGVATSNNTNAVTAGFDDLSGDTMTYGFAANWTPEFGSKPGIYNLLAGYTSKSLAAYDIDERHLLDEITGQVPVVQKSDNYALTVGAAQYLYTDSDAKRSDGLPVGFGPFFRFGVAPRDRNVITQFYSAGLGGYGGLADRSDDNWGIGWAGTKISSDFRRDAEVLGFQVDGFEHAAEAFYNFALTPAMRLSFHVQYINSANPERDEAVLIASRLTFDI